MLNEKKRAEVEELVFRGVDVEEQETCINTSRDSNMAEIYTSDNTVLTKLKKLLLAEDSKYELIRVEYMLGDAVSVTVACPKNCVSFRAGKDREMSDEQRMAAAERFKALRESRNNQEGDDDDDNE